MIEIKACERKRVLRKFSNSMPMTYRFSAEPINPEEEVSGTVEIKGSNWIFPGKPVHQELATENVAVKGMWNSIYSVFVTPDVDVRVKFERSSLKAPLILALLVSVVIVAAVSVILISLK